ncbi:MAG: hypothetical protein IPK60_21255 [Sandaracinaceae bacterium]|nr:hypothetical protein [Sandaracinaceae bacterium]
MPPGTSERHGQARETRTSTEARAHRPRPESSRNGEQGRRLATYLSRVENCLDPSPPTEKTLRALAEVLGDSFDELMQLAGRVPEDVEKLIKGDPDMPVMLRRAREQNVTGAEFLEWLGDQEEGGK